MKAILISIKPEWVEKILNGEKTVEVRKTMPETDGPFKVYIYCTKVKNNLFIRKKEKDSQNVTVFDDCPFYIEGNSWFHAYGVNYTSNYLCNGKVVAEFTCDEICDVTPIKNGYNFNMDHTKVITGFEYGELTNYLKRKSGYAWHITDLKIYDKPKALEEFYYKVNCSNWDCGNCEELNFDKTKGWFCDKVQRVKKAPQSWCYVEEL